MPIGLGLASSHAPNMFAPPEKWEIRYNERTRGKPQPLQAQQETVQVIKSYVERITAAFKNLERRLADYRPDALIMVGDDQGEIFDRLAGMPTIGLFLGEEAAGSLGLEHLGESAPKEMVRLRGHPELAEFIAEGLIERNFDLTCVRELRPMGRTGRGLGHAFTRTAPKLMPDLKIPIVIVFLNCYYPPLPTARRCYDLGRALRELLDERPERIAIYGSGGLSHDPIGPRAGWIDEPLDRFLLQALAAGKPERLLGLYTFDSDTVRSGTGEIRNWITVAGACHDRRATVIDYIPAYHAVTGLGFAAWAPA
jgi:Catalytic LigB subunit of aromatic ring-opening dioxygenase